MSFSAWCLPRDFDAPPALGVEGSTGLGVQRVDASPAWVTDLATALRASRDVLLSRRVSALADVLGRAGGRFLDPGDPLRAEALEYLPATSGLSAEMAAATLDGMASDWTAERLHGLLAAEFPEGPALDGFVAGRRDAVRAVAAPLTTQIVAGSVPGVGATALLRSLLVKSPTLLKPGLGDVVLPVLLARAIQEEDPELARALAVVYWPGDSVGLTAAAVAQAGAVVAYGSDEAVVELRAQVPVTARFVAYHHRVSAGVVGRASLAGPRVKEAASEVAGAVGFFDQRGCVSPQVVYVEEGGEVDPPDFADRVADAMAALEEHLPGGTPEAGEAAALQQTRGTAEMLAASGRGVTIRHGGSASWTVVYDPTEELGVRCVARTVRIVPVPDVMDVPGRLEAMRGHLQTVGVSGCGERLGVLANRLADAGVTRVTPFERVPFPPPWWHHDGQGPLTALVDWVELDDPR